MSIPPLADTNTSDPDTPGSAEAIYRRPADYDLEYAGYDDDARFYCRLMHRLRPTRLLEMGCGSGRATAALAEALPGATILGLDMSAEMLQRAEQLLDTTSPAVRSRVRFQSGDMRDWQLDGAPFDAIVIPGSSVSHLLTMEDRLRTWRNAFSLLKPGGAFVLDVRMPDFATLAESQRIEPRALLQLEVDAVSDSGNTRLMRSTATTYHPHEQRADVRFFYDRFDTASPPDRFISDYESHIYFPSEMELLFEATGFATVARYGTYDFAPFGRTSPYLITWAERR